MPVFLRIAVRTHNCGYSMVVPWHTIVIFPRTGVRTIPVRGVHFKLYSREMRSMVLRGFGSDQVGALDSRGGSPNVSREKRPEIHCLGLFGRCRL
eukprot:9225080-Heterocapsa_arctica.AAC.1